MNRLKIFIIFFYIFSTFYVMNIFTPFSGDDYTYYYNLAKSQLTPINSFRDVFQSQYYHYLNINGRAIPHVLEQIFMGLIGKGWFNILNSFIFIIFIYLIYIQITSNKKIGANYKISLLCIINIVILFILPYSGQTEIWMDGSFNYMWPIVMTLILITIYQSNIKLKKHQLCILFSGAIIAGWTHEGIVIPFAITFLLSLSIKEFRNTKNYLISIGYLLGTIAVSFAPGIINRFFSRGEITYKGNIISLILNKILDTINFLSNKYLVIIAFAIIILSIYKKTHITNNLKFLFYSYIFSLLLLIALGLGFERIFFSISVISFLIIGKCIERYKSYLNNKYFTIIFVLLLTFCNIYAINICYKHHKWYNEQFINKVQNSQSDTIILATNIPQRSRFTYIDEIWDEVSSRNYYYNKKSIMVLENKFYNIFTSNTNNYPIISSCEGFDLRYDNISNTHFITVDNNYKEFNIYGVQLNNTKLKPHQLLIRKILGTYNTVKYTMTNIDYKKYEQGNWAYYFFTLPSNIKELRIDNSQLNLSFHIP